MNQTKISVLVVDDEPYVLVTLRALLAKEYEVLTADSGEAAMRVLSQREVDLLLTDLKMPGLDGVQLLEWARQHSPRTMRLAMTGLGRLEDAVAAINTGQVHRYLTKPWGADELLGILREAARTFALERSHEQLLEDLRQLNQELENRVQQRTSELEEANRQLLQKNLMLEKLALTDPLTGMPNRRAMDRLVRSEVRRRVRYPGPLALALIDVDYFKDINSRYLLPGGDQVLIGLAQTLMSSVRTVDTIGRVGGDEFLLLAPLTDKDGVATLMDRVRSAVEDAQFRYENETIRSTVSIGCAVAEASALVGYEQLRLAAAEALQEAKRTGRNRSVIRPLAENSSEFMDGNHRKRDPQESEENLPVETEELES